MFLSLWTPAGQFPRFTLAPPPRAQPILQCPAEGLTQTFLGKQLWEGLSCLEAPAHTCGPAATSKSLPANIPRYHRTASVATLASPVATRCRGSRGVTLKGKIPWNPAVGAMSMFPKAMFLNMLEGKEYRLWTNIYPSLL